MITDARRRKVRRRLHYSQRVARRTNATAFAGIVDDVVVSAAIAASSGKAIDKNAVLQIFTKRLIDTGLGLWTLFGLTYLSKVSGQPNQCWIGRQGDLAPGKQYVFRGQGQFAQSHAAASKVW